MQHPDEGTIHAWIDGELPVEEAAALEAHLKGCAECSALAAEARGLVAASSRIVSALDIVPGNVIPKAQPRRRAWYASTQLRAAAAVVIVAGASLLVVRNGGQNKMQRVMESSAPAVAADTSPQAKELDRVTPVASTAPERAAAILQGKLEAPKIPEKKKSTPAPRDEAQKELEGRVSGAAIGDAIANAPKAAQRLQSVQLPDTSTRRPFSSNQLSEVVMTGVAVATEARELKKVRTDSAKNETVYEVRPGVEVTLTDNAEAARIMLRMGAQSKAGQRTVPEPAPAPPAVSVAAGAVAAKASVTDSITWTSRQGHRMVLKGPLSKEDLEKIRQRLNEDQR